MKQTKPQISHEDLFVAIGLLFTASMFFSKFLTSLSMGLLVLLIFVRIDLRPFHIGWNSNIDGLLRRVYRDKTWFALSLLFWIPFLSGLWSDDVGDWLRIVRIRLPFLLLPLAFASLDQWPEYAMRRIAMVATGTALLTIPAVLYHFISDKNAVLESLEHGKMLWTPAYHIRYSLLLAYSGLLAFYYGASSSKWRYYWWGAGAIIVIFLHFLAVRSGLFVFYAITGGVLLYEMVKGKHRWKMATGLILLVALPIIGVKTIPSLQQKWKYMRWDLERIARGEINEGSDNKRVLSFRGGLHVFREHPIIGVGAGDLKQKMRDYFIDENLQFELYPHNQYIFTMASTGLIGLFLFLYAVFVPLFHTRAYQFFPALAIQVIILLSFLVENTLETSLGVAIYLFFTLASLRQWRSTNAASTS